VKLINDGQMVWGFLDQFRKRMGLFNDERRGQK
jgi:hypothetical protein